MASRIRIKCTQCNHAPTIEYLHTHKDRNCDNASCPANNRQRPLVRPFYSDKYDSVTMYRDWFRRKGTGQPHPPTLAWVIKLKTYRPEVHLRTAEVTIAIDEKETKLEVLVFSIQVNYAVDLRACELQKLKEGREKDEWIYKRRDASGSDTDGLFRFTLEHDKGFFDNSVNESLLYGS